MIKLIRQMLRPLETRLSNMVARAVVSLVNDGLKMQGLQLQVLDGETRGNVERFQSYGLTSVPLEGAEAVVLFVGGRRDHGLAVAVDDRRHRPRNLAAGEVMLYTDEGAQLHLKRGRIVVTDSEIRLGSDSASNFVALAHLVLAELNAIRTAFDTHTHVYIPGAGTPTPTAIPVPVMGAAGSVAASKVKAE